MWSLNSIVAIWHIAAISTGYAQPQNVSGGIVPPERLITHFEVHCDGKAGGLRLEQTFNRAIPSGHVSLVAVAPLGRQERRPRMKESAAFGDVLRVNSIVWSCAGNQAIAFIAYVSRSRFDSDVKTDRSGFDEEPKKLTIALNSLGMAEQ